MMQRRRIGCDGMEDFSPMNRCFARSTEPELYAIAANLQNGDLDILSDDDRFVTFAAEYEHLLSSLEFGRGSIHCEFLMAYT
jgi:hypothetical protein